MKLDTEALDELCRLARAAALRAGRLIRKRRGALSRPEFKVSGGGPASTIVTETDRLSERLIRAILAPSMKRFELGLLTEETADDGSRFERDHFWCVDPLDGTLPYSEGRSGFAVSIALVSREGRPLVGVVHDPLSGALYHGIQGRGAFKNGRPLLMPGHAREFSLVVDRSFVKNSHYADRLAVIQRLLKEQDYPELRVLLVGGAVMNALHVLEHPPACYLKFPGATGATRGREGREGRRAQDGQEATGATGGGSLWDYAAAALLFQESGAYARDFFGGPLDLNRTGSTFLNHRGILFAADAHIASALRGLTVNSGHLLG